MISQVYTPKPQFTWHKIASELRANHDKKFTKILLTPSVKFCIAESQDTQVQTRLFVDMEKSIQFQSNIGWNWHKSSNIPILSLKITIVNPKTGELFIPSEKLQARIYAVKIGEDSFEKEGNFYLEDVGLKGQTKIQLNDGCGYFHSLRFTSTSYNNQGRKFHLLIVVSAAQNKNESNENILCSLLSSPIFVDSRKSARNYQVKKYLSFVNLFELSEITKPLCQNDMKQETQKKLKIFNSEDGLYTYLTAPNIRNKIKHPLFLAHHFSNALKIHCNTKSKNFTKKEITLNRVINILQKKLINELGMLRKNRKRINVDESQFVITISLSSKTIQKAKIFESLQYLECKSIHILEEETFRNPNFIEIFTLGNFEETYRKQYAALKAKSERQISVRQQKLSKEEQEKDAFEKTERNKADMEENLNLNSQNHKFCFSKSNEGEHDNIQYQQEKQYEQKMKDHLEFNDIVLGQKRVKINQEQNLSAHSHLLQYPAQVYHSGTVFPQSFMPYNLNSINENYPIDSTVMVKKEESYEIKNLSRNEIVLKIKQMCMEVYHRNKFTIMYHLQTLKKSNVKWQVKDVQNFVLQYSESLMGALSFREQLLHHMYLENQIMKAKVGIMKQMALGDLQHLKRNIMSMNAFLPEKFIVKKLKDNQLWSEDHDNLFSKPKFAGFKEIQYFKKDEKDKGKIPMIDQDKSQEIEEQKSSGQRTPKEYSFNYSCNFVSNVFEFEQSPLIEE